MPIANKNRKLHSKSRDGAMKVMTHRESIMDPLEIALDVSAAYARRKAAHDAQHGPVRSLMVNGKPGPDAPKGARA